MNIKNILLLVIFISFSCGTAYSETLSKPVLYNPANAAEDISTSSQNFSWSSVTDATVYRIVVLEDGHYADFVDDDGDSYCKNTTTCFTETTSSTSYSGFNLKEGTKYFWIVRAGSPDIPASEFSAAYFITKTTLIENKAPTLVKGSATPNSITSGEQVTFESTWDDPENKYVVDVQVRFRKQGTTSWQTKTLSFISSYTFRGTYTISGSEGTYEYQFRASDADTASGTRTNTTSWSSTSNFTVTTGTGAGQLSTPVLTNPAGDALNISATTQNFNWNSVSGATKYRILVLEYGQYGDMVNDGMNSYCKNSDTCFTATLTSSSYSGFTLKEGTKYYWLVWAGSSDGSEDSEPGTDIFTTGTSAVENKPPVLVSSSATPSSITSGEQVTFESTWNDPENKYIVDVQVRFRKQGSTSWQVQTLSHASGYTFRGTYTVTGSEGTYEYQVRASDADTPSGAQTNTTNWLFGGSFEVQGSPTTGSLQVIINPSEAVAAGAQWKVKPTGSTSFQGPYNSGDSASNLEPGSAVVQFVDVTGWLTPEEQTVTIVAGDIATASGEYTQYIEKPDVCIGHDYEQQTPLAGVTPPTVEIAGDSAVNEQAELSLSANSTVDEAKGGNRFYYWCAEKGLLQADPAHPDYSQVKFIAPKVAGSDEDIRIYAKVGDTLGYVGRDIFHVNVAERSNYDASDPAPTFSVTLPDSLYAGRPFRILYTIADALSLFAARAEMSVQAMTAEADTATDDEPAPDLYTNIYISTDGGDFVQVVKGLRGENGAYTVIPPTVTDNFSVKVVVTDGNSTVEKIIEAPAVQPWYEISGYCSDGTNGEPIPNCLVQAAEYGRALSDYTGGFELAGLTEGSFTVSAGHADYYFEPRKVSVALTSEHPGQDVSFTGWPLTDNDDDGMPDIWEEKYFNDLSQDGSGDFDQDGLADLDEFYQGTDPTSADSDADGISDGWEVLHGLDPLSDDSGDDPDNDGFSNYEEYDADTDPNDASSHPVVCHFRVPDDYATLTLAVLAAHGREGGAAVCVSPGTYKGNFQLLDKVWLVAESKDPAETVILGNGTRNVITMKTLTSGGVVGFTIKGKVSSKNGKSKGNGIVFSGPSLRAVIARNIFTENSIGILLRGNVSPLISNNTIVSNSEDGVVVSGKSPAVLRNNIVADNGGYGIIRNGTAIDVIAYNDAFGNSKADYRKTAMGEGGLNADPLFADGYRLGAGSPCLDAGRTLDSAITDMGAYGGNTAALVYSGYVPGPPDSDEDGISDDWEMRYFADLAIAGAKSDRDGDGYSDYAEYVNSVNGVVDPDGSGFDPLAENAAGGEGWESGEHTVPRGLLPVIYELLLKGHE